MIRRKTIKTKKKIKRICRRVKLSRRYRQRPLVPPHLPVFQRLVRLISLFQKPPPTTRRPHRPLRPPQQRPPHLRQHQFRLRRPPISSIIKANRRLLLQLLRRKLRPTFINKCSKQSSQKNRPKPERQVLRQSRATDQKLQLPPKLSRLKLPRQHRKKPQRHPPHSLLSLNNRLQLRSRLRNHRLLNRKLTIRLHRRPVRQLQLWPSTTSSKSQMRPHLNQLSQHLHRRPLDHQSSRTPVRPLLRYRQRQRFPLVRQTFNHRTPRVLQARDQTDSHKDHRRTRQLQGHPAITTTTRQSSLTNSNHLKVSFRRGGG